MKRLLSALLTAVMLASLFTACSSNQSSDAVRSPTNHTIQTDKRHHILYFKDKDKCDKAVVTFFNSADGNSTDVEMEKIKEDDDSCTFSCEGDTAVYNMAYITHGDKKTNDFAFNNCVSGWNNSEYGFLPYTEGEEIDYFPHYEHFTIDCNGYDKKIHIWTPDGYDPDSDEPYASIYLLDGQDDAVIEEPGSTPKDVMNIPEQVRSMTATTGYRAIIIGISTYGDMVNYSRDDELIPNIGEMADSEYSAMSKRTGNDFARFVAETLVPYIRQNYHVYSDARHTSVTGASLGGLEAFYIGMEYPDIFGTVGALSPSFWTYGDTAWTEYLKQKDFEKNTAFLYIYSGGGGDTDMDGDVTAMAERLKKMGYPEDKLAYEFYEPGGHHVTFWRRFFSEFLEATVFQRIEPLQKK